MEIKSCPFCGDIKLVELIQPFKTVTSNYAFHCFKCGAMGPLRGDPDAAAAAWNMRMSRTTGAMPTLRKIFVKLPSACRHEFAHLSCADCGIDFPRASIAGDKS